MSLAVELRCFFLSKPLLHFLNFILNAFDGFEVFDRLDMQF
jgi:hypothetical protein